ncbi:HI0074 family nucleotidyltransferase substrate-binding subunit [Stenoxybacter acetivorans]|uniref:HI0074 family nucleotidyltransferase substrate-binding subunit n=1 Tax=Stenoxybacter acetivorans TaxID=422441 RepID=UPI00056D9CF7|nr:HI0074 family nucleotidyltransferase substrate-binding subunit [Stenoxybacter acetivorans]
MEKDIRWRQRLENFERSCKLLSEIENYEINSTPAIVCEGFIQRFEICFDLAWKTVNDYLRYLGHDVMPSPRPIIKEAFAVGIIEEGQVFIDMLEARNLMSHRYDEKTFNHIFLQIQELFFPALFKLCKKLNEENQ